MLSLIVPTYNERDNVDLLWERVTGALAGEDFEILYVDDSTDDTPERVSRIAAVDPRVRLLHRTEGRGLATAVVAGVGIARGDLVAVIDGDLQHPPEILPELLAAMRSSNADVIVPSRYIPGGDPGGLSLPRRLLSLAGRALAQFLLTEARLTTDPMSGFFVARRSVAKRLVGSEPLGFKILLEMLVRGGPHLRVHEVPYRFASRTHGQSKLGWKTQVEYGHQVLGLMLLGKDNRRQVGWWLVGGAGVAANLIFLSMLLGVPASTAYGSLIGALFFVTHASMLVR